MRTVTYVEEIKGGRGRSNVYLDEAFAFSLYKTEICDLEIKTGDPLPEEAYLKIINEILPKRARLRAMHLLAKRPYTEAKLREKLKCAGYTENAIEAALDYVKSFNYIDDLSYAKDFIEYNKGIKNKKRLISDLMQKGVDKETIYTALDEAFEDGSMDITEQGIIEKELRKKHFSPDADYTDRAKIIASLLRKGFSMEAINISISNFSN